MRLLDLHVIIPITSYCQCICTDTSSPCGDIALYKVVGIPVCKKHSFVLSPTREKYSRKRIAIYFPAREVLKRIYSLICYLYSLFY